MCLILNSIFILFYIHIIDLKKKDIYWLSVCQVLEIDMQGDKEENDQIYKF